MTPSLLDIVLAVLAAVVLTSVVLGSIDVLRQPGWAWRAAGEPKWLSLMLVVLLPGVGLAIYVFGARPKVVTVAAAGRAANLPFERFGDRQALATENTRSIQALMQPTQLGSFGERRPNRTVKASGPVVADVPAPTPGFFQDPDLRPVGDPAAEPQVAAAAVATATEEPAIRIPGSLGRPYNPVQRTSLPGSESLATVASPILGANQEATGAGPVPSLPVTPAPAPSFGAPPAPNAPVSGAAPAPTGEVAGPTFVAPPLAHGFGHRSVARIATERATALQLASAPVATPGTPEIFRPAPEAVAPIGGGLATAVAVAAPPTMAQRWLPDPTGRHQYRYWDGGSWTENVYDAGVESRDRVAD